MTRKSRVVAMALMAALVLVAGSAGAIHLWSSARTASTSHQTAAPRYHCAMHPNWVSDRPGDCPICGMRMVPIEAEEGAAHEAEGPVKKTRYRSTMNPTEISDHPGKDSMGMEMVPVEIEEPAAGHGAGLPGRSVVKISAGKQQLIGVKTSLVKRQHLTRTIKTVGRVTFDETRLHHVHTKVSGWIERLYADTTGALVKKGQPLLTLYSPELVASQQEYILALRARGRMAPGSLDSARVGGDDLVASARKRLQLFDLTEEQIAALETSGEAPRTTTLYAPMSGHVISKNVSHGERIDSGTALLELADLSHVWVLADVYEYELPFVSQGQKASMTLSYLPGRNFDGEVTFIYPVLTEATRTVKVRLEFANPDLLLKPEMYAQVELFSDLGEKLVAPDSAVISTGERDVAFVDRGDGYFEPRELRLGARLPDAVEVLEGLEEGERVLTSGNFFVDSESKMKAALSAAGDGGPADLPAHQH
jgi:RND family efflux transporter MFP subunit